MSLISRPVGPLRAEDSRRGVIPRFRDVVTAQEDALAVADDEGGLTYGALAAASAGVLALVRQSRGPAGPSGAFPPVGVLCSHDPGAVAAILGVIASGSPLIVLDPRTPPARLAQCAERAGAGLIVADATHEAMATDLAGRVVVPARDARPTDPESLWASPPDPTAPAVLAFTSGSTGVPKLVANDHRLLTRDAWNSSHATGCYGPDDVLAHTLPMAFHAGLTTTVIGMLVGATMRLYDARSRGIAPLPEWIAANGATVMITSPAILRAFVALAPDPVALAGLRSVTVAGEALHGCDAEGLRSLLPPGCVLRHRYGSSETGLIAEYPVGSDHPPLTGFVPVGHAVGETRIDLAPLDVADATEPPASGTTPGVVTVTAPYVALGYWQDDEATAAAFTDNADGTRTYRTSDLGRFLPDGNLQLTGRRDHSVKIRGYLVDPGEVDAVLFSLPEVREAVVVGRRTDEGRMRLAAYVVPTGREGTIPGIRSALRAALPAHMVPEAVVFLDALPRTERGKIDRSSLPPPPERGSDTVEEQSGWEELVASVWCDVLGVERVALADDFFALGGDSLAVEALLARLTADLDVPGDVATSALLVQAPTLGEFAARLRQAASAGAGPLVPLQPCGRRLPLFLVAGGGGLGVAFMPWVARLGKDQPVWALQSPALEGRGLPDRSVESMARRYVAEIRRVQPHGPYQIAGHSFGGLVAFEAAHRLRDAGEEVALLGLLDSFPPDPADHPPGEPQSLVARARSFAGLALTSARSTPGGEHHWRFYDRSSVLGRRYHGRPWPGRTLVVVAQTPEKHLRGHWEPWLTGDWSLAEVSGDHLSMTRQPWADEVADVLGRFLGDDILDLTSDATVTIPSGDGPRAPRRVPRSAAAR
ncbi:MAG: hypothetical protein QG622_424 [Actinomycetota bacterium]|nr:hypothetical protein [Actinomycetota bacterium]